MARLSKTRLMSFLQCPKRLWLEAYRPALAVTSPATEAAFAAGHAVGAAAREIYGGGEGVLIDTGRDLGKALLLTREVMLAGSPAPVFEATFDAGGVLIRADVLMPMEGEYRLVEVKASTRLKDEHVYDCAIQHWVMSNAGMPLGGVALAHVDNAFVYRGDGAYGGLLVEKDLGSEIAGLTGEVSDWVRQATKTLAGAEPAVAVGAQCDKPYACPFKQHCWAGDTLYPVTALGGNKTRIAALVNDGFRDIRDVPASRLTGAIQRRIRKATCSGLAQLDPDAVSFARALAYPRYYLDFETIAPAVPVWAGTRPYEALPVQYSCHIEPAPGQLLHDEFLDLTGEPPMRRLAESLLTTLRETGPVLTYSGYERRVISGLAVRFPDLAEPLERLVSRLVDLLPVAKRHYYHPAMLGSWSIKAVLPTVAPDMQYAGLDGIKDGAAASEAYLRAIAPDTVVREREELERQLRTYCRFDTEAMVRLLRFFESGGDNTSVG